MQYFIIRLSLLVYQLEGAHIGGHEFLFSGLNFESYSFESIES